MTDIKRLKAENDRLRELLSELYQILGELDGSEQVLDRVLAAAEGRPFSNEPSLLPYISERTTARTFVDPDEIPDLSTPYWRKKFAAAAAVKRGRPKATTRVGRPQSRKKR